MLNPSMRAMRGRSAAHTHGTHEQLADTRNALPETGASRRSTQHWQDRASALEPLADREAMYRRSTQPWQDRASALDPPVDRAALYRRSTALPWQRPGDPPDAPVDQQYVSAFALNEEDEKLLRANIDRLQNVTSWEANRPLAGALEYSEALLEPPEKQREQIIMAMSNINIVNALVMSSVTPDCLNPMRAEDVGLSSDSLLVFISNAFLTFIFSVTAATVLFSAYVIITFNSVPDRALPKTMLHMNSLSIYGWGTGLTLIGLSCAVTMRMWIVHGFTRAFPLMIANMLIYLSFHFHFFYWQSGALPVSMQYWGRAFAPHQFYSPFKSTLHQHVAKSQGAVMARELADKYSQYRVQESGAVPPAVAPPAPSGHIELADLGAVAETEEGEEVVDDAEQELLQQALPGAPATRIAILARSLIREGFTAAILVSLAQSGGHGLLWKALDCPGLDQFRHVERAQLVAQLVHGRANGPASALPGRPSLGHVEDGAA